jgi:hypothetical protein
MLTSSDEEGNLTPSAPAGPPRWPLFDLNGPLALMPGPPPLVVVPPTPLVVPPPPLVVAPPVPAPVPRLVSTPYERPRRARSALSLILISVVLGTLLAAAIGLAAAVTVAAVNRAVSSSSTTAP